MSGLKDIVGAGEGMQEAVDLGDGIWMSKGVANVYRIVTADGDVQVNTGMASHAAEHARRFDAAGLGPVRVIVLTQGHPDHVGGWSHFAGPGVETIAQAAHADVREYWRSLRPFYSARNARLWGRISPPSSPLNAYPTEAVLTTTVLDHHAFTLGGRRFELIAAPGGETLDGLVVWLPSERTVLVGNLTGPMFGHVPNLYTIRGDKIRSAMAYLHSIERVRDLDPQVYIDGHHRFEGPVIRETLDALHAALTHLRDRTFEGMNAGRTLWQLMDEVTLPPDLQLPQWHGRVPWLVRAMYEEHVGWFRFESTTELYEVPPQAVWPDVLELAGADPLAARARQHAEAGRPLQAIHLAEVVLAELPTHPGAVAAKRSALEQLLERAGGENQSEVAWLETELEALDEAAG